MEGSADYENLLSWAKEEIAKRDALLAKPKSVYVLETLQTRKDDDEAFWELYGLYETEQRAVQVGDWVNASMKCFDKPAWTFRVRPVEVL